MKRTLSVTALLCALLSLSCTQTRYITERHIKTEIEKHVEGETSTIRTYSIYKGNSLDGAVYLEMTGYRYKDKKALLIGADRYYLARPKFKNDPTIILEYSFIELTFAQCKAITENYKGIQQKAISENPRKGEEIYHDYTVSKDMFISFKNKRGQRAGDIINLWIKGEKYQINTKTLISKLNKFLEY
jgi:hypothetical protein